MISTEERKHISNMVFAVSDHVWKTTGNLDLLTEIINEHKLKLQKMAKKKTKNNMS